MPKKESTNTLDWEKLTELFEAASDLTTEEQEGYLDESCGTGTRLRAEVERLLTAARKIKSNNFLGADAFSAGAYVMAAGESGISVNGRTIGHYKILSEIARGGMGVVYLAERDDFQHRVALKLIKNGHDTNEILRRFRIERDVLASLNHPNIARLHDGGTTPDGLPFLVMEYVAGMPIDRYCRENGAGIDEVLRLFIKVCAAVEYAHRNLTVHRDIKPSNILVTEEGEPKLLDFGIAKILDDGSSVDNDTVTGSRMLTPEYCSPEHMMGEKISTSSDVYSLGVLLYELLTGRRPFNSRNRNALEMIEALCTADPPAPSSWRDADVPLESNSAKTSNETAPAIPRFSTSKLKGDLDNIVLKALRKDPAERYSSVEQFSADVERHLAGLPVLARPATFGYRAGKFLRRHRIAAAFAALAVTALCVGSVVSIWQAAVARNERVRAQQRFNDVRQLANTLVNEWDQDLAEESITPEIRGRLADISSEYLEKLSVDNDDQLLLSETAHAQIKLGHDYAYFSIDREKARESFLKAEEIARQLVRSNPDDDSSRLLLALCLLKYDEFFGPENISRSIENKLEQISLRESISKDARSDLDNIRDLAIAHEHLGDTLKRSGRSAEAGEHYRKADEYFAERIAFYESAANTKENAAKLASALSHRASNVALNLFLHAEGTAMARRAVEIAAGAADASPTDRMVNLALVNAKFGLGEIARETARDENAISAFRSVISSIRSFDPGGDDGYFVRKHYDSMLDIARIQYSMGRSADAEKSVNDCFRLRRDFSARDANRGSIRQYSSHAFLFELGGKLLGQMGRIKEAERAFDEAELFLAKIPEKTRLTTPAAYQLAIVMISRGDLFSGIIACENDVADLTERETGCMSEALVNDQSRLRRSVVYYRRAHDLIEKLAPNISVSNDGSVIRSAVAARIALLNRALSVN